MRMKIQLFTSVLLILFCIDANAQSKPVKNKPFKFTTPALKSKGIPIDLNNIESFFSYIPMSSYRIQDGRIVSTKSFYMLRFEVPNMLYRLFINDLKAKNKTEDLKLALPDTNAWGKNDQPMIDYYFSHLSFNEYPVVQVSRAGVLLFCKWLGEQVKALKLKEWKNKKIEFRLPNELEWMVAASGGDTAAVYAWKGPYMRMGAGPWQGDYMANFRRIADSQIFRDENKNLVIIKPGKEDKIRKLYPISDNTVLDITAPINNYWPNAYGLFCMTGNVREMVQEEGFSKGGSWIDPGGECMIDFRNTVQFEGFPCEGFRIVAVLE